MQDGREAIKTSESPEDGNLLPSTTDREANRIGNETAQGGQDATGAGGQEAVAGGENQAADSVENNQETKKWWLDQYIVPSKSLEDLAEGWQAMVDKGQVLSLRRNLGIYEVTLPFVEMVQKWFSKKGKE